MEPRGPTGRFAIYSTATTPLQPHLFPPFPFLKVDTLPFSVRIIATILSAPLLVNLCILLAPRDSGAPSPLLNLLSTTMFLSTSQKENKDLRRYSPTRLLDVGNPDLAFRFRDSSPTKTTKEKKIVCLRTSAFFECVFLEMRGL